ncbi:MAG: hypothetical protein A3K60_01305 [Euryarchaeota archaeon RBG_19FT_COMBO_56_21]|nr:MAG: hypothetical protein A3K60_01305 [Euryarchaeota archaeon RBG_19FT_COMBO_56_21]
MVAGEILALGEPLAMIADSAVAYFYLSLYRSREIGEGRRNIRFLYLTMVSFVIAFIVSTAVW